MDIVKKKVILPTNDYCFKKIFGKVGNEEITKDLLEAILDIEIESVDLDKNTILEKDLYDEKLGILDIKAKLNNNILCNIEMQVVNEHNIEKRLLYYWSKLYISSIKKGEEYDNLQKTIVILIADFEIDNLREMPECHTKWEIREAKRHKKVLTDVLELHIMQLPKTVYDIRDELSKNLLLWLRFIINPDRVEVKEMESNEAMMKAKEEYDEVNEDEEEFVLAEYRTAYTRACKSKYRQGFRYGKEEGKAEGKKEGIEEGKEEVAKEIAKRLLDRNISIDEIVQITGVTEREVNELANL